MIQPFNSSPDQPPFRPEKPQKMPEGQPRLCFRQAKLPRNPGKSTEGERRSPVFLLVFGPEGRTLYVALEDGEAPSAALPAWWERLAMLGHAQRRVRARTAVEAWRLTQICPKKLAIIEG